MMADEFEKAIMAAYTNPRNREDSPSRMKSQNPSSEDSDEFVDAMSSPDSDMASGTYTISGNDTADEGEELENDMQPAGIGTQGQSMPMDFVEVIEDDDKLRNETLKADVEFLENGQNTTDNEQITARKRQRTRTFTYQKEENVIEEKVITPSAEVSVNEDVDVQKNTEIVANTESTTKIDDFIRMDVYMSSDVADETKATTFDDSLSETVQNLTETMTENIGMQIVQNQGIDSEIQTDSEKSKLSKKENGEQSVTVEPSTLPGVLITSEDGFSEEQPMSSSQMAATPEQLVTNELGKELGQTDVVMNPLEKKEGTVKQNMLTLNQSMIHSKVENLESMEVPADAIMGLSVTMPSIQNIVDNSREKMERSTSSMTPNKMPPSIDSRTITRPPKPRSQQLPEAIVSPLVKGTSERVPNSTVAMNEMTASLPIASSTPIRPKSPKSRCEGPQLSNIVPAKDVQSSQQTAMPAVPSKHIKQEAIPIVPSKPVQQAVLPTVPSKPVQQATMPTVSSKPVQQVPTPEQNATSQTQDQSKRPEQRHRTRQRTITVQSQVIMDINSAFSEVKQMGVNDPMSEVQHRVQSIVATKEKEWAARNEKLAQLLAHEQRRNEPLEQKAAERFLAMGEYEKLVKEIVEELKKKSTNEKNSGAMNGPVGGPGPERNLSPDGLAQIIKERDQFADEVNSLETSYSELFRRYEKLRQASVDIKQNEENVKKASEEMSRKYATLVEKFDLLRKNAEEQLELANNEIERLIKQHDSDTLALRLKVKQLESKNDSLHVSLEAKQKEIENMTVLFEEVINKAAASDDASDA